MMVVKELPEEVWSMIAQRLKREPPPAGAKANWNDHFHQQDLVNLQRVSKTIYSVVSPILYHSPIVQNLGLFLEGIQHPYDKNNESTPFHKLAILQQVRKLHLIYASSNVPVEDIQMEASGKELTGSLEEDVEAQYGFVGDRLGTADINGLTLADDLLDLYRMANDSTSEKQSTFKNLEALSFGTWDDGRWRVYANRKHEDPDQGLPKAEICPSRYATDVYVEFMIHTFEMPTTLAICQKAQVGHDDPSIRLRAMSKNAEGLRVIHHQAGRSMSSLFFTTPHIRSYVKITTNTAYYRSSRIQFDLGLLFPDLDDRPEPRGPQTRRNRIAARDDDLYDGTAFHFELCLVQEDPRNETLKQKLRDIKATLEQMIEEWTTTKKGVKKAYGKISILIGDDIPACPCCGSKE